MKPFGEVVILDPVILLVANPTISRTQPLCEPKCDGARHKLQPNQLITIHVGFYEPKFPLKRTNLSERSLRYLDFYVNR